MLKAILILIAISFVNCDDEKYTTQYDDKNIDEILHNDRILDSYVNCLMCEVEEKCKCTEDAKELKKRLKEALETDCAKCSDKQKENLIKAVKFLSEKKPALWARLLDHYDPDGKLREKYAPRMSTTEKSE